MELAYYTRTSSRLGYPTPSTYAVSRVLDNYLGSAPCRARAARAARVASGERKCVFAYGTRMALLSLGDVRTRSVCTRASALPSHDAV